MTVVGSSLTSSGVVWGSDGVGLFVVVAGFGDGVGLFVVVVGFGDGVGLFVVVVGFGDGVGLFVVVFGLGVGVETSENIKKLCKTLIQT